MRRSQIRKVKKQEILEIYNFIKKSYFLMISLSGFGPPGFGLFRKL
jgi:hypothetical protein